MDKVYLGVPSYDMKIPARLLEPLTMGLRPKDATFTGKLSIRAHSLLAHNFNMMYCDALNKREEEGYTHFCLLHNDIVPLDPTGWLQTMLNEMHRVDADILSAVVPMKGMEGLTTTGFDRPDVSEWATERLTLKQIFEMDETFTLPNIVVNSGLMLIDITKDFASEIYFAIQDTILMDEKKKKFKAYVHSEDWYISRQARALGASVWATRKVPLIHIGHNEFPNTHVWGNWKKDHAYHPEEEKEDFSLSS